MKKVYPNFRYCGPQGEPVDADGHPLPVRHDALSDHQRRAMQRRVLRRALSDYMHTEGHFHLSMTGKIVRRN